MHNAAPPAQIEVEAEMHDYYAGEARSAYVILGLGAASIAGGAALVTRDDDFARGFGWPLLVLGALESVGAAFYAFQVHGEIRHYEAAFAANPAGFRDEEITHMRGTTSRFVKYQATELGLFLGGAAVATYGYAANQNTWKGAGLAIATVAFPFLLIDEMNGDRAKEYLDTVERFDPHASRTFVPFAQTPWMFSVGAAF
ncbi:MAG: hypothetical protein ACRELY_05810 [Polyangiaceae bacterium]